MKFGTRFYDGTGIYFTKIRKNPSQGIFFITFLNYEQKFSKKLPVYCLFRNSPVILIQNVISYFYLKGENKCKNFTFTKLIMHLEDQISEF